MCIYIYIYNKNMALIKILNVVAMRRLYHVSERASGIDVKSDIQRTRTECRPQRPGQRLQLPRDFCVIEYNVADATEAQLSIKKVPAYMRRNRFSNCTIVSTSERTARTRESNRLYHATKPDGRELRDKKRENKKERTKRGSGESDRTRSEEESNGDRRWNGGPDIQGRIHAKKWVESSQAG